jgi:peptidoglycan/xylan/chitin deacetylase (PgdA/CDA1 family)
VFNRFLRCIRTAVAAGVVLTALLSALRAFALHAAADVRAPGRSLSDECATEDGALQHGLRRSGVVALTFDACPTTHVPGFSPDIADQLQAAGIPATFFISGRWAEAHPAELARLASVPFFEIALHGYRHRHLRAGALDGAVEEIEDGRAALQHLGQTPQPLFRPPYGDHPTLLAEAARRTGVTPVLWDVAPGDPDPHETARDLERSVLAHVQGGSIIILHVNGRGVATAAALPAIIAGIQRRGLQFVTASELVKQCAAVDAARLP